MNSTALARSDTSERAAAPPIAGNLRVLHVISGLGPGGAETVLFRLIQNARTADHEVICLGPREWYSERLEQQGIRVHHLEARSLAAAIPVALRLYRTIRMSEADVVQCWMYRGNVFGGLASQIARKRVVWNLRCSDISLYPPTTRALARLGGFLARSVPAAVFSCSVASWQDHLQIGYGAAKCIIIPNGYDPRQFYPNETARAATRNAFGINSETFLAATIGRWDSTKAYPVLLEAIRSLRNRGVPIRILLIGRGLEASNLELRKIIDQFDCGDFVELLGYRADVPHIARALDVHVLASITEGFPNVIAETMLSGTPNVATDAGDSGLIVGRTGWIVRRASAPELAKGIGEAYQEWRKYPQKWIERRAAARERIEVNFSIASMVQTYENLWRQIVQKGVISG